MIVIKARLVPHTNRRCHCGVFENADKVAYHVPHRAGRLDVVRMCRRSKPAKIRYNKVIVVLDAEVSVDDVTFDKQHNAL
jgi:hypothetical protein